MKPGGALLLACCVLGLISMVGVHFNMVGISNVNVGQSVSIQEDPPNWWERNFPFTTSLIEGTNPISKVLNVLYTLATFQTEGAGEIVSFIVWVCLILVAWSIATLIRGGGG